MFEIFTYLTIFIVLIFVIFHILVWASEYLLLIDEQFVNKIKNLNESITDKLVNNESDYTEEKSKEDFKKFNSHLRFDFLISIFIAILLFTFPKLIFNLNPEELSRLPKEDKYLSQFLSILVLFSSIVSAKTIKKKRNLDKKIVLITKIICAVIVFLVLLMNIYFLKRINYYSVITLILISLWIGNNILPFCF